MGCEHYSRSCRLLAPCCGQWYSCRHCHNAVHDTEEQVSLWCAPHASSVALCLAYDSASHAARTQCPVVECAFVCTHAAAAWEAVSQARLGYQSGQCLDAMLALLVALDAPVCQVPSTSFEQVQGTNRHVLDRHAVQVLECIECGERQPVARHCNRCGTTFGAYSCLICNFFDNDDSKEQFHCNECGICRVGGEANFFHCATCGCCYDRGLQVWTHMFVCSMIRCSCWYPCSCSTSWHKRSCAVCVVLRDLQAAENHVPGSSTRIEARHHVISAPHTAAASMQDNHQCVANNLQQPCPVCGVVLFDSVRALHVLRCGHALHQECHEGLLKLHWPLCMICMRTSAACATTRALVDAAEVTLQRSSQGALPRLADVKLACPARLVLA